MAAAAWAWSAGLISLTITFHFTGILLILQASRRAWKRTESDRTTFWDAPARAFVLFVGIAIALAALHGIESFFWAIVYWRLDLLPSFADAVVYSIDAITTVGAPSLALEPNWRIMGGVEAGDGMLLFGISTAFLFTVMQRLWRNVDENSLH